MPTVGQVKRALVWERWRSVPRFKRAKLEVPKCLTCGAEPDGEFAKGEPRYNCSHPPMRIDDATMARGRRELRG